MQTKRNPTTAQGCHIWWRIQSCHCCLLQHLSIAGATRALEKCSEQSIGLWINIVWEDWVPIFNTSDLLQTRTYIYEFAEEKRGRKTRIVTNTLKGNQPHVSSVVTKPKPNTTRMKWKGLDMREASIEARAAWGLSLAWRSTLENTTKVQELG